MGGRGHGPRRRREGTQALPSGQIRLITEQRNNILRPRENPKSGWRVDPGSSGLSEVRSFRVLTWTEYSSARVLLGYPADRKPLSGSEADQELRQAHHLPSRPGRRGT